MSHPPSGHRLSAGGPDTRRESIERRILESAQALVDEGVSWNQLGIRQIAERAEISRTAFYDFFGSKNEVLEHLIRGVHEDLTLSLAGALDPGSVGRYDLSHLRPALEAVADFAERHGYAYRAFLDATAEDDRLAAFWDELLEAYAALLATAIETAREQVPEAPTTIAAAPLARVLLLMTERSMVAQLGERFDRESTVAALCEVWERSVFGTSPTPRAAAG